VNEIIKHPQLALRGQRDDADYDIIAQIRDRSVRRHLGPDVVHLDRDALRQAISSPGRLCVAEIDGDPAGLIFVVRAGATQLDEFRTLEGKSWLFVGPTCAPEFESQGIENRLLEWLVALAQKEGIAQLIRFTRIGGQPGFLDDILAQAGFLERLRYYLMRLELSAPPSAPRQLPAELELVDCAGEQDFELLMSVLAPSFEYGDGQAPTIEDFSGLFGAMAGGYFPICLESASRRPVGTIAMLAQGAYGQIATFGVIPPFQRRGIGSLLMERAIDHAWRSGVRTIDLSVRVENPSAIRIYQRFGFQSVPERTTIVHVKEL